MGVGLMPSLPVWAEEVAEVVELLAVVTGAVGYSPVKHLLKRTGHAPGRRP